MAQMRSDVAIRSVNVNRENVRGIDFESPICVQYNLHGMPSFIIVDPEGHELARGADAARQVYTSLQELGQT